MAQSDVDIGWDFISKGQPDAAMASLFGDQDGDPKVAAESVKLSADTGVPAEVIYADPERFKRNQMSQWADALVRENPHLQSFLTDDGMAAKIGKNDLVNLDIASQALKVLDVARSPLDYNTELRQKQIKAIYTGFQEGFGSQPMLQWTLDPTVQRFNVFGGMTLLGYPTELLFRSLNAAGKAGTDLTYETMKSFYEAAGGDERQAHRFGREFAAIVESETQSAGTGYRGVPRPPKPFEGIASRADFEAKAQKGQDARWQFREELDQVRAWIEGGEEVPPGLAPAIDKLRVEQSRQGLKDLEDAAKASDATETRELSPETYRRFVRQHETSSIEVNGEAIRKLYGDKLPEVDDGVLGHVIIGDQLETALATGGDVTIPMDMWLSTIEPDVRKALKDDIRVRPGLLTGNEIKDKNFELKVEGPEPGFALPPPLPQVRAASGLEPMFAIGDRKVKLERMKQEQNYTGETQFHDFNILDQEGNPVGSLNLSEQKGGKELYIEMIQAGTKEKKFYDPNFLGPALIRDLYRQLKEEFPAAFGPDGLGITGHRVSGAREKAGTWEEPHAMPRVKRKEGVVDEMDFDRAFRALLDDAFARSQRGEIFEGAEARWRPPEEWSAKEHEIAEAIQARFKKLAPKSEARVVDEVVEGRDSRTQAVTVPDREPSKDLVIFTLMSPDRIGDVNHEAIHTLRRGFFTDAEWNTLREAAVRENWHGKYGIERFYKDLHPDLQLEEAVAEHFRAWAKDQSMQVPKEIHTVFERLKAFFEQLRQDLSRILGKEVTWEDVFKRVESGEVGSREQGRGFAGTSVMRAEGAKPPPIPKQGELDVTRAADKPPFQSGAMSPAMTADMQARYMKLIKERNEADIEAATKRAERFQKAQQTEQWKRDRALMRVEVEREINNRPDVAADLFFSRGELYGESLGGRPKIDPTSLDPELLDRLKDTDWVKKGGMDANDAAALFGFRTPEEMFNALAEYQAQREEGIGAKRQRDRLVDAETDRQMELRYGRLDDNIIAEARDQAASETQLNLLHEETFFLASQANKEFPLTRQQMRSWAEENFGKATFADTTAAKWFQTAGKVGRQAEEALLKGDPATAFTAKQQQYFAMSMAQQAIKLEKEKRQFEKDIPKYSKREVKGIDREFVDFVQEMLIGSGIPLRVTMDEVQQSKLFHGNSSLKTFVDDGLGKGWGLDAEISPELQHGIFKDIKTMSVNDFRDLKDAVDALAFTGRRTAKIFAQGRLADKNAVVDSIIDNLKTRPKLDPDKEIGTIHKILAATKRPEQIIKDLDDHAELGPAFRNLWEPMTVSSAKFLELERDLTAKAAKMTTGNKAWMKSLGETIPNDFFFDPHDGTLFNLNRGHLVRIALNWGNEGNIRKFAEGWAAYDKPTKQQVADFRARMENTLQTHMRPEDWAYVRDVWDIFAGWQSLLDTVHRNTSGKLPKWVRPDAIKLPDGSTISEGGYFPLIPDKTRLIPGTGFDPLPNIKNGVMQRDYFRPTTTKSHMMDRQINAKYRVSFLGDMGEVALRMQQVMHDIAYRESMMDVSGLLADKRLRTAIKERYSPAYLQQLDAWLVRQANHLNYDEIAMAGMNNVLQRVRGNLVAYALPLNANVVLSPALGLTHPWQWKDTLWNYDEMKKVANEHSRVVPHTEYNLDRDFREHIESIAERRGWDRLRVQATKAAYWPMIQLEQRLRTVTFTNEFRAAQARGLSDYDASQVADSAVRERHGAQTLTDLPTLMASNEGYKMMTVFMGYFNTMDNWSRQIPGQIRREEYMKALQTAWGAIIVPAAFGALLFNKAKEDEPWWKTVTKAMSLQMVQGLPFAREASSMFWEGYKPTAPLASVLDSWYQLGRDVYKYTQGKPTGNVIRHAATAAGTGFGVPGTLQVGKTGQFMYDYYRGKQRPRDGWEWIRGLRTGEARLKKGI